MKLLENMKMIKMIENHYPTEGIRLRIFELEPEVIGDRDNSLQAYVIADDFNLVVCDDLSEAIDEFVNMIERGHNGARGEVIRHLLIGMIASGIFNEN